MLKYQRLGNTEKLSSRGLSVGDGMVSWSPAGAGAMGQRFLEGAALWRHSQCGAKAGRQQGRNTLALLSSHLLT